MTAKNPGRVAPENKPYPLCHECGWCNAPANYGDLLPSAQVYAYDDAGEDLALSGVVFGPSGVEHGEEQFACHLHLLDEIENTIDAHYGDSRPVTFSETIEQIDFIDDEGVSHVHMEEIVTSGDDHLEDQVWSSMNADERRDHNEWIEEMHDARVALAEALPSVRALARRILDDDEPEAEWWASAAKAALKRARKIVARLDYEAIVAELRAKHEFQDDGGEAWHILIAVDDREHAAADTEARV